jgi:surface antigen
VTWSNPDSGLNYKVTPIRGFNADGRKCREYMLDVNGNGVSDSRKEQACQTSPGQWETY